MCILLYVMGAIGGTTFHTWHQMSSLVDRNTSWRWVSCYYFNVDLHPEQHAHLAHDLPLTKCGNLPDKKKQVYCVKQMTFLFLNAFSLACFFSSNPPNLPALCLLKAVEWAVNSGCIATELVPVVPSSRSGLDLNNVRTVLPTTYNDNLEETDE